LNSTFGNLFRTHPTTEDRIVRLEELKNQIWDINNKLFDTIPK
jgi:Zn-dependent protease with chaperone function